MLHFPSSPAPGARQRILAAAHRLFYQYGIRATGIDRLLAEADVARMSFYKHFPSKQALVVAFLHERHTHWQQALEAAAQARAQNSIEELLAVFAVLGEWFAEPDFRGCAFINTILETADPSTEEHLIARQHKQALRDYLEALLVAGGVAQPPQVAAQLLLLIDGAIVRAQLGDGPAAAATALALARRVLPDSCSAKK